MPEPYTAVGLIPTVRGIRTRADIGRNLEHISHMFKAATWLSSLDLPVRLVAIPEGGLQAFNVGFVLDRQGELVLKHYKLTTLYPVEHSMTPHDVWDRWVELYGLTLDAFFPVADTEIGRLGVLMANEGSYPENAPGLAMNGAEV